jgi:hypothetical protein
MFQGTQGLERAYALTLVIELFILYWHQAPARKWLTAMGVAIPLTAIALILSVIASSVFMVLASVGQGIEYVFDIAVMVGLAVLGGLALADPEHGLNFIHRRGALVRRLSKMNWQDHPWVQHLTGWLARQGWQIPLGPRDDGILRLAGVPVPPEDETRHFKLIGTTGTGKSTGIREMLATALRRGDRAIFADPDHGYVGRFRSRQRGDVILSPFHEEGRRWDPFAEIAEATQEKDVDALVHAFIPDPPPGENPHWTVSSRLLVTHLMHQCIRAGRPDGTELLRLVNSAPMEELRQLLTGTAAASLVQPGSETPFESTRCTAGAWLGPLAHTIRQEGEPFSVREWVSCGKGVLFLPYKAGEIASVRTLISVWMRLAITQMMDGAEDEDQRLWLVVDELDALGKIDGLTDALARLRKFGGRCVLGFQSIAQLEGTYGRHAGSTIAENCSSTLILRCSAGGDISTADFASKLIGDRQVSERTRSTSRGMGHWSATISEHGRIDRAVLPAEIEQLPDGRGFLKLPSNPWWLDVELELGRQSAPRRSRTRTPHSVRTPVRVRSPIGASTPASPPESRRRTAGTPPLQRQKSASRAPRRGGAPEEHPRAEAPTTTHAHNSLDPRQETPDER